MRSGAWRQRLQFAVKALIETVQADGVNDERANRRRDSPEGDVHGVNVNARAQQKGVHQGNRAKRHKEQPRTPLIILLPRRYLPWLLTRIVYILFGAYYFVYGALVS